MRKNRSTKNPFPCQQNRMPCALNVCQDTSNDYLSMDSGYGNYSCINFPYRQGPNQVDSSIDLQDKVILPKVVTQPTKETRSVGPHKLIPKKSRNKRKSRLEIKKFRSVNKPVYWIFADHNNNSDLNPPQHLSYKSGDKNHTIIVLCCMQKII